MSADGKTAAWDTVRKLFTSMKTTQTRRNGISASERALRYSRKAFDALSCEEQQRHSWADCEVCSADVVARALLAGTSICRACCVLCMSLCVLSRLHAVHAVPWSERCEPAQTLRACANAATPCANAATLRGRFDPARTLRPCANAATLCERCDPVHVDVCAESPLHAVHAVPWPLSAVRCHAQIRDPQHQHRPVVQIGYYSHPACQVVVLPLLPSLAEKGAGWGANRALAQALVRLALPISELGLLQQLLARARVLAVLLQNLTRIMSRSSIFTTRIYLHGAPLHISSRCHLHEHKRR